MITRSDELSDAELLARTVTDLDAFAVFYRRHVRWVLRVSARRTGSAEHAADLRFGHARSRSVTAGAARIPSGARSLVAQLGVLRRPQTAADRAIPASLLRAFEAPTAGSGGPGEIVPSLTRLLATLPVANSAGLLSWLQHHDRPRRGHSSPLRFQRALRRRE